MKEAFHIMAKPSGSLCNLDCIYCFYLEKEKLYPDTNKWAMSKVVLENYIRKYIESQETPVVTFSWQGGEPTLLGLDFYEQAVKLQSKYANGKKIENTFQTNGVLLDDSWCEFFAQNNFLIGLSIDGPQEIHNRFRVFKGGQTSHQKVVNGLRHLKKHNVEFNTLTCVQKENAYQGKTIYNYLKDMGSQFIQFIPIVERIDDAKSSNELNLALPEKNENAKVSEWSVEPLQFGKFLVDVFNEWIKEDVGKVFVQMFDVSLEAWATGRTSLCVFSETCGNAAAIEHNGDVYSCDHYVFPEYKLGNVLSDKFESLMYSQQQRKFGEDKKSALTKYCKECKFKFACWGDCPKHRFEVSPEGEYGLSYLCSGYKYFFNHVDKYMNFMVEELNNNRPPANVMHLFK